MWLFFFGRLYTEGWNGEEYPIWPGSFGEVGNGRFQMRNSNPEKKKGGLNFSVRGHVEIGVSAGPGLLMLVCVF